MPPAPPPRCATLAPHPLTVAAAWLLVSAGAAHASGTCSPGGVIESGRYWLHNNTWGRDSGTGWSCLWSAWQSEGTIGWGTNWSWTGSPQAVKSYTSGVLGWHWGWRRGAAGLPLRVSSGRSLPTSVEFAVAAEGTVSVAYDLWIHNVAHPTADDDPSDEVAIWLHRSAGARPPGSRQATLTLEGTSWDLYRATTGWNLFTFVRTSNTHATRLDLRSFLGELMARGWLSRSSLLTGIQFGAEVRGGSGRLDVLAYTAGIE